LGAGSIGCLFASALHRAGCDTTLILRDEKITGGRGSTAVRITAHKNIIESPLPISTPADAEYVSHLLVTTKAYDAGAALASIAHRLDENSHILVLVNGMGVLPELEAAHPGLKFYAATTTEGAFRRSRWEIVHAGTGITKIGRGTDKKIPAWFEDWSKLSVACVWEQDIEAALWQKLAVNCAINPMTALFRCNNGQLLARGDLAGQLAALCDEISTTSAAAGQTATADGLYRRVVNVIENTADNRSSMLQDVLAGRSTEIEYISGYLVGVARRLQVPAPLNEDLLIRIRNIHP
jgi:2-dehydropantoate 2-reductase